jgi:C-terminal processing protease CtpA/Prc
LLIDPLVMSTAENFAVALVDSGRATAVGRRSGGASGNPISFKLPGEAQARFSTGDFRRLDGTRLEGIGVQPQAPVAWTIADARAGRDPDVETAVSLIIQEELSG